MGVKHSGKGVKHLRAASRLYWKLRYPNVPVAVAGENKDSIDGHGHGQRSGMGMSLILRSLTSSFVCPEAHRVELYASAHTVFGKGLTQSNRD
jgi:hypothetical protein